MSKTVDILLIGGSWHGAMVNSLLPVPATINGNEYVTRIFTHEGQHYRVGVASGMNDQQVATSIWVFGHNPSWDLRPPYGNYTPPSNGSENNVED